MDPKAPRPDFIPEEKKHLYPHAGDHRDFIPQPAPGEKPVEPKSKKGQ